MHNAECSAASARIKEMYVKWPETIDHNETGKIGQAFAVIHRLVQLILLYMACHVWPV
jgi:hypothetical protein